MKSPDWKSTAELIGIAAIVASLIFVGLQLKQSQDIALSQASQARTSTTVDIIVNSAENAHFISSLAKRQGGSSATESAEDRAAMRQYSIAILYLYEDQHFQYLNGFLPEERWRAARDTLAMFLSGKSAIPIRTTYEEFPGRYTTTFQSIMNDLIAGAESEAVSE